MNKNKNYKFSLNILGLKFKINLNPIHIIFKIIPLFVKKFFDKLLPKSNKKIVFYLFPKFENNVQIFYNYLKKYHNDEFEFYFITPDDNIKTKNTYNLRTFSALYHMYSSKYVINTHASKYVDYFSSKKHIYINIWHGMPIKTIGFCEKKLNKTLKKRYEFLGKNSYMFATSDIFKQLFISSFHNDYKRVFVSGTPRTDAIWSTDNDTKIENLYNFSHYKKIVFYLPTFKNNSKERGTQVETEYNNIFYMDDYNENQFINTLKNENILFLMKPHPVEENFYKNNIFATPKSENFKIIYDEDLKKNAIDLYEIFKFTDLMISDFSSVTLDFLILNKPVIYLNNLADAYAKGRGFILEDNYEILMPGIKADSYKILEKEMLESLNFDNYKEQRTKELLLIHKYLDNNSSERIYKIMKDINENKK